MGVKNYFFQLNDGDVYDSKTIYKNVNIEYTRNFANTKLQSWFVPFNVNVSDFQDKFTFYKITNVNESNGSFSVHCETVDSGIIPANTPSVVQAKEVINFTFSIENTTLYNAKTNKIKILNNTNEYTFIGTYKGLYNGEMAAEKYYAMSNGMLNYTTNPSTSLKPFRWYCDIEEK